MARRAAIALMAAALLATTACARTAPPAPVAHYGVHTREGMRRLVVEKTPAPAVRQHLAQESFRPPVEAVQKKPVPDVVTRYAAMPVQSSVTPPAYHQPTPQATLVAPGNFLWPVRGRVVSTYGPKKDGLYNDGINIAAPRGTPVAAAADGVVAYVGDSLGSYGNLVLIRHGGGVMTAYAHLDAVHVREGMSVRKGGAIGVVGTTGAVVSSQLHFEIRRKGDTVDPMRHLG